MAKSGQPDAERRVRQGAVPTVPRASARFCYGLHRVVEKGRTWALVARTLEAHPRAYQTFTALEKKT